MTATAKSRLTPSPPATQMYSTDGVDMNATLQRHGPPSLPPLNRV